MFVGFEYQRLVKSGRELTKNVNRYLKDGYKLVCMVKNDYARVISEDGKECVIFRVEY